MDRLIIFDLDGTIAVNPHFYREVYSGTLSGLIEKERGTSGLKILDQCRMDYAGRGELALFALGIPFKKWAQVLINAPLHNLKKDERVIEGIRNIVAKKVIYTGSPRQMALRILHQIGLSENDFDLIIGWEEPETFPLKWSCSPLIFENIVKKTQGKFCFDEIWSVGDTWETDLAPAKKAGAKTVLVGKADGIPDFSYLALTDFLKILADGG